MHWHEILMKTEQIESTVPTQKNSFGLMSKQKKPYQIVDVNAFDTN